MKYKGAGPVVARSKARRVLDLSNTGTTGSNSDWGMDVYPRLSLFWYRM